jgi:hypothetical protein
MQQPDCNMQRSGAAVFISIFVTLGTHILVTSAAVLLSNDVHAAPQRVHYGQMLCALVPANMVQNFKH